jgi:hypothetical protein
MSTSPDFNVGDVTLLRRSTFHPEQLRKSLTPDRRERPAERPYEVRVIAPAEKGAPITLMAARDQLQHLDLGDPPWRVPQFRFFPARVRWSDPDTGEAVSRACVGGDAWA